MINDRSQYRYFTMALLCLNLFACTSSSSDSFGNTNATPVFISAASIFITENTTTVVTLKANDAENDTIIYSIVSGADQTLFSIDSNSGDLTFINAPDFELPGDGDNNNIYLVQVVASDATGSTSQLISVTISNINDNFPAFTSASAVSIVENTTDVITVNTTDDDNNSIIYRISGGVDQALFSINSNGDLSFISASDFENPNDNNNNNIYIVQVSADDGANTTNQTISVTVTDLDDTLYGLTTRPSNTTCIIPDAPSTSTDIELTPVFTNITLSGPIALRSSPTITDRWYVAEQAGRIKTFLSNDAFARDFADLTSRITSGGEMGLLGLVFHPDFATNNYVYVYYSATGGALHHQSVIARFTASDATTLDLSTETIILRIDQPYSNHNGGNILFGPDGYLYIGMGDGGSGGDPEDRSQDITTLLGKMLRINVDTPANGNNYSSPADNPFVGVAGRDEIYALGLRNPWRWSFDRQTGDLILADVGQNKWEEIDIITKGGNYGWRCYEGNHAYNTAGCDPQSSYISPIHEYDHSDGFSITGGYVYRGSAIPALNGIYIYSDYGAGPIWGLSDPTGTPVNSVLINLNNTVTSFAEDNNGEIYVLGSGRIYRIDLAPSGGGAFPKLLSDTGCIDPATPLQMAAGLIPYEINAPFWSDNIIKDRWMTVPDASTITIVNNDWVYPNNSILVKNFTLNGKRVETRLLVRHADGEWGGYSYEWNDSETDASLLLDGKVTTKQSPTGPQTYIYPSSTQCMRCHTQVAGIVLGPETNQINRDTTYSSTGIKANQLTTLEHIGMFSSALADIPANLPKLTDPSDLTASIHDRARAYLYTNCAQCHQPAGPTNANLDFHIDTLDTDMNICNAAPTHQIAGASAIMTPGNAADSTMYLRMNCREGVGTCNSGDEMPPLGSVLVDTNGALILSSWINSLTICP